MLTIGIGRLKILGRWIAEVLTIGIGRLRILEGGDCRSAYHRHRKVKSIGGQGLEYWGGRKGGQGGAKFPAGT